MVKKLMDDVHAYYDGTGNLIVLLKSLHHPKNRSEQTKIPPALRQAQGERDFGLLNCGF